MRLGVSYNVWDGDELLQYSIANIRDHVDYVCVVDQEISNLGIKRKESIRPMLESLIKKGLVDDVFVYEPDPRKNAHANEITKRRIGLDMCRDTGCTYHLNSDCDEFYIPSEFKKAKRIVMQDGYDSSACMMQTYYKSPLYALDPPETYFVPFIYRIDERTFELGTKWPVVADPTRKMQPKNIMTFARNVIEMHHYSMVRRDIRAKLWNSSASTNFKNRIEEIAQHYEKWQPGSQALMPGKEKRLYEVKKVENYFGIKI